MTTRFKPEPADAFAFKKVAIPGFRKALTEEDRFTIAKTVVEHLKLSRWMGFCFLAMSRCNSMKRGLVRQRWRGRAGRVSAPRWYYRQGPLALALHAMPSAVKKKQRWCDSGKAAQS